MKTNEADLEQNMEPLLNKIRRGRHLLIKREQREDLVILPETEYRHILETFLLYSSEKYTRYWLKALAACDEPGRKNLKDVR